MTAPSKRKLTAILATDIVSYSRLMEADEIGTLNAVKALRSELIAPKVAQYGGRSIKLMGDGELIEFSSVVEAAKAAVEVQAAMSDRNEDVPEDRQIVLRIGIHIGDVIIEDDDLYGDGVNIAARLEALAPPGGICLSRDVHNQIRDKLKIDFDDLGAVEVKNIARPVEAFTVVMNHKTSALRTDIVKPKVPRMSGTLAKVAALIGLLVVVAAVYWFEIGGAGRDGQDDAARLASIIVLPFDDLSPEKDFQYFADGMSEDITTELARWKELKVVARSSAFTYQGKSVDVRQVATEMGVRYVLEGSVRRAGPDAVRINAQLIDGETGGHIWAERFDQAGSDVLALQDQITSKLAETLGGSRGQIKSAQYQVAWEKSDADLEEYDYYLRGHDLFYHYTPEDMKKAREIWEAGLEKFPSSGLLMVKIGISHYIEALFNWAPDPAAKYELADMFLATGMADPNLPSQGLRFGLWSQSNLDVLYG